MFVDWPPCWLIICTHTIKTTKWIRAEPFKSEWQEQDISIEDAERMFQIICYSMLGKDTWVKSKIYSAQWIPDLEARVASSFKLEVCIWS
jgi:hypothetical protein